jgi:hypothetical protein
MTDFISNLKNKSLLLSENNDENNPNPVTETEEVVEDVRPIIDKEENPKK